ncbi:MAG: hypothetical protein EBU90_18815 [Proteobacteria bacterium]|nr:hypothetical protein [Pseudomonadota bacterium]NBP16413.1 hypothetical protein [bacterium]
MDDENKLIELFKYSDPREAQKKVHKLLGKDVDLYVSTRKNKKYMIRNLEGKMVHFGYFGMEDYLKHKNEDRRKLFKLRNHKWKDAPKYSPSYLSYWVLW